MAQKILIADDEKKICELLADFFSAAGYQPLCVYDGQEAVKVFLENAISHTSENGQVTLVFEKTDDFIKIKVFNTGEKIPADIMPNIWESFWRADKAHSRSEGRFGLGLSIVSAIIKNQSCSCGVYNTDDGVCFSFTLPAAKS
jgi:signal transduction histidine kinase